jgi:PE-PPE domain
MGNAKHIGRVGALAVALGVGNVRRTATRMTVSIGAAALVVTATVVSAPVSTVSPAVRLSADSTALIMGGTSAPTPDDAYIETVRNQFIAPTHPGQIDYVAVTTPEELWPLTGVARLLGLALGPPIFGLGGPAWPDEPLWKLSGLFDLTADQSVRAGAADLEDAMAKHPNDHLVIYGYSQGAGVANEEKRSSPSSTRREPRPPISTSCWAVTPICPTAA